MKQREWAAYPTVNEMREWLHKSQGLVPETPYHDRFSDEEIKKIWRRSFTAQRARQHAYLVGIIEHQEMLLEKQRDRYYDVAEDLQRQLNSIRGAF